MERTGRIERERMAFSDHLKSLGFSTFVSSWTTDPMPSPICAPMIGVYRKYIHATIHPQIGLTVRLVNVK